MKYLLILSLLALVISYDRNGAVKYAHDWAKGANHKCGQHDSCTPCSYWGSEHCGYRNLGGDCANFVSQCLVKGGGHAKLNGGLPCRGYPCGFEEVGAKNLGDCLQKKGWTSKCGHLLSPPSNIQAGDVLIYHSGGCGSTNAHAVLITKGGSSPKITCHSNIQYDTDYNYMKNSKPYYQWLHKK